MTISFERWSNGQLPYGYRKHESDDAVNCVQANCVLSHLSPEPEPELPTSCILALVFNVGNEMSKLCDAMTEREREGRILSLLDVQLNANLDTEQ